LRVTGKSDNRFLCQHRCSVRSIKQCVCASKLFDSTFLELQQLPTAPWLS